MTVSAADARRPQLVAGTYTVSVTQEQVAGEDREKINEQDFAFVVAGPKPTLSPKDVDGLYPARNAKGAFADVIAHVALRNSAFPWLAAVDGAPEGCPWIGLLLLSDTETADASTFSFETDAGDTAHLKLDHATYNKVAPATELLTLLAHVRERDGIEDAVLLSHRIPARGEGNTVFVVSMKDHVARSRKQEGHVTIPVLMTWRFHCTDETPNHFAQVFSQPRMGDAPLCLPDDGTGEGPTLWQEVLRSRLGSGYVAIERQTRAGSSTISWYRGPLVPSGSAGVRTPASDADVKAAIDLVVNDGVSGLEDVTYAAAWELGRLLGLQDRRFTREILAWRRCCARDQKSWSRDADVREHMHCCEEPPDRPLPERFFHELARLDGVPFGYLVPAPEMLPNESLRGFELDPLWIYRLLQGALSIGAEIFRCHESDGEAAECLSKVEAKALETLRSIAELDGEGVPRQGFLLRSEAVDLWPDLRVAVDGSAPVAGCTRHPLPQVRLELCDGPVTAIRLELPVSRPHFELPHTPAEPDRSGEEGPGSAITSGRAEQGPSRQAGLSRGIDTGVSGGLRQWLPNGSRNWLPAFALWVREHRHGAPLTSSADLAGSCRPPRHYMIFTT